MAVFTETIKLDDGVSGPAKDAAGALDKAATSAMNFGERMALIRAKKAEAGAALAGLGDGAKKVAKEFPNLTDAMLKAQGADEKLAAQTLAGKNAKGDAAKAAKDLAASEAMAGQQSEALAASMTATVGAAIAVVTAIAAVVAGIGALIAAGVKFAIESNEAKMQMLGLFDAMGQGIITGEQTEAMIDELKAKFGIAKDSLVSYTNALMQMGRTDLAQMEGDLLAIASASALVKGGDQALLGFIKKIDLATEAGIGLKIPTKGLAELAATGANVGDVAKIMGVSVETLTKNLAEGSVDAKKFGAALNEAITKKGQGPLERMAASSANLKKLLQESLGDLFEDIDVGPFMAEVKSLFDIFSQGKASGQTLKSGIGGFFKEVMATLTKVVPMAKHFLLDLVIYGLRAYIALKPIVKTIREFAASATGVAVIDGLVMAFKAIGVVVLGAVAVIAVLAAILVTTSIAFGALLGTLISFGISIMEFLGGAAVALAGWVAGAATAAYDFVAGLVAGIANGGTMVVNAVKGLASSALGAFTGALGISSPSKVMMTMGGHMTDGVAEGLDAGAGDVAGASSGVAGAAVKGMAEAPPAASQGGGKGGANITVQVLIDGAGKSALEITEEMVAAVFGRMALEAGV